MRNRGFTIVELLMVVAIIAVLIAILVPVLGGVFRQAVGTQCLANLHQYGIAFEAYRAANNGQFPAGRTELNMQMEVGNGRKTRPRFFAHFHPWMGPAFDSPDPADQRQLVTNPVYLCPTANWADERNFSYGYNYQFLGNARQRISGGDINYPVNLSAIEQPSRTVVMADCMGTAAAFPTDQRLPYNAGGTDFREMGNHAWTLDPPGLPSGNYVSANPNVAGHRSAVDPRHNGKANVLFADGHAKAMTPEELGYVIAADGSYGHDGDNTLWSGFGRHVLPRTAD
jgi:prepilin-type processing-associated H-X9-DG protein/prepilin-type N-terminal cleavage/methylation domain-containing protein